MGPARDTSNRSEPVLRLNALNDRSWLLLSRALFACLGVVIVSTFLHYGLTYDEEVGRFYGRHILSWYTSFFKDRNALAYYDLYLYGGFFETIAQLTFSLVRK